MNTHPTLKPKHAYVVANGDLRLSANQKCWPEQAAMEAILTRALKAEGWKTVRAHPYDQTKQHGFIDSQKMGMEVRRRVRVAIQPAHPAWALHPSRTDSHRRQLERHLAGAGRHVEPQRLAHEN